LKSFFIPDFGAVYVKLHKIEGFIRKIIINTNKINISKMNITFGSSGKGNSNIFTTICYAEGLVMIDIMTDGSVIHWSRDSISDDWNYGLMYDSQKDYNENLWSYKGEMDPDTKKPLGFGQKYCSIVGDVVETRVWPNGDKYEGEFLDELTHGQGKMTYAAGHIYEGEWANGKPNGYGRFYYELYDHMGEFKDGLAHGPGKLSWYDGATYEGVWTNDMLNGPGKYKCDNYIYHGEFVDDLAEGFGKIKWYNGNSYKGMFKDDEICLDYAGGKFIWADGSNFIGKLGKIWGIMVDPEKHKH